MFKDRVLLITGGTGTFGDGMLRRVLQSDIGELRIFSRDEKKQDDMRHEYQDGKLRFYIGDVRAASSLRDAMDGVDYVFHAAALKQVPTCEFYPLEAVQTNILGADNVITAAVNCRVRRVVVLSTDKAAYPINAMGMTKGLMEKVALARSQRAADRGCVVSITRYGNVMGSRGSVIPLFVNQSRQGRALTLTDPEMTRFMMSLDDALDLVMHAFENGAPGDLYVQKAPAATMRTLAEAVLTVLRSDVGTRMIGTRHGEKLYETLLTREEMARATDEGDYYRVGVDVRDLNYEKFVSEGEDRISVMEDYHSHGTHRLSVEEMCEMLVRVPAVQAALGEPVGNGGREASGASSG